MSDTESKTLAIVGGGPAALMVYKRLLSARASHITVHIFESTSSLGSGMPYSDQGASVEHVTNVSADELPDLAEHLDEWVKELPAATLEKFGIRREDFHEKRVLPRLLFGQYLKAQFEVLLAKGAEAGIDTTVHYNTRVGDVRLAHGSRHLLVDTESDGTTQFDLAIICTGHHWPTEHEGKSPGYFDSPYPPQKLARHFDHAIAIRGSSLTAIDAIRTISRCNGKFKRNDSKLIFSANDNSQNFRVVMHSRQALLPCVRVHMEEPHAADNSLINNEDIQKNIDANDGFLQLDFLFENGFKLPLKESDPKFYEQIKDMTMEEFVDAMMSYRGNEEPFDLLVKEYHEANNSIEKERPVYWKEMLSALSFAMNYPAKHLSAEDMLRLQKQLIPLISVVIAFVPQSSCEELLALHDAGRLDLVTDGGEGEVKIDPSGGIVYRYKDENGKDIQEHFDTFVNCTGQRHLSLADFPFQGLVKDKVISNARLKFKSSDAAKKLMHEGNKHISQSGRHFYLQVPGARITDNFHVVAEDGTANEQIYLMAVPYMGGYNPDYSGLDFCEHASELIVGSILKTAKIRTHSRNS